MNHPVIISANATIRYNQMLHQAEHYRQVQKLKGTRPGIRALLLARFVKRQQLGDQLAAEGTVASM
jgi:hypothetical protein